MQRLPCCGQGFTYPTHIPAANLASFDWGSRTGNSLQLGSQTSKHLHHLNSSRSCL
ncbi:hypothetical protein BDQ94DRAFT_149061 [Aspergillus welwitschiae]|uniref:Uncharacterized protein n=1 Tax=Aspergillus welwitschiae TaxID=1341132 RepID=A0A3F3PU08_9EURO|nr:hypothetical protein BDQ94DRAFT_149061 [Aspergillus welwitschiae]RDH30440.1 hypothetical protein BDQ94DRAFT_149061 [Aspergillus welwitschiae]